MLLNAVSDRFIARTPMAVAIRGPLEYAFAPEPLDAVAEQIVGEREDRQLLFSTCVGVMGTVVTTAGPGSTRSGPWTRHPRRWTGCWPDARARWW